METEQQQEEEEEEKNSFYSSYKEAVQGEGREGVEDPLREVDFFSCVRFLGLKLFPQIRIYRFMSHIYETMTIHEVQIIRVIYKHFKTKYGIIMTIFN